MTAQGVRRRVSAWLAFVVTDICGVIAWVYLFLLNRTDVTRPYGDVGHQNVMFIVNHQSPLDSFLVTLAAFFPRALVAPRLHPWSLAAEEYWFRNRRRAWLARHLRCIPVKRNGHDAEALETLRRELPRGMTVYFPEGRRSPDGRIRRGLPGAGYLAHATKATVVPVAIDGLLDAMPYSNPRPRIGRRIRIAFGDPISCDDLFLRTRTLTTSQAIVDRAMSAVTELHYHLRAPDAAPVSLPRAWEVRDENVAR